MVNAVTITFIREHVADNVQQLAFHKSRYLQQGVDIDFALQQIEGRQRMRSKLPSLTQVEGWWYPPRLSLEQCSSEQTARYKAALVQEYTGRLVDLTGGFGIDTFYLSEHFQQTCYVERQETLCEVARHNFALAGRKIDVYCGDAEAYVAQMERAEVIYMDPARRSAQGGKVFRLQDCEPDLTRLYEELMQRCRVLLVKLSPMLDITDALRYLKDARSVHVVAVRNEVKEVVVVCERGDDSLTAIRHTIRWAVNLDTEDEPFAFTQEEENTAVVQYVDARFIASCSSSFLYEPNAAILKAGAFRAVAERYQLQKLGQHTHLYVSETVRMDFPGRIFRMLGVADKEQIKEMQRTGAHTLCRNYPLTADKLAAKYKIREGGEQYLIGTRVGEKNVMLVAERVR